MDELSTTKNIIVDDIKVPLYTIICIALQHENPSLPQDYAWSIELWKIEKIDGREHLLYIFDQRIMR